MRKRTFLVHVLSFVRTDSLKMDVDASLLHASLNGNLCAYRVIRFERTLHNR